MPKSKMQLRSFMQNRVRSHSQDLSTSYILDSDMSCNETLQDLRFLNKNFQQPEQLNEEQCTCQCAKCMSSAKNEQTEQLDAEQKKRLKRRQYKKRQKAKAQQKKQLAQQELGFIVTDIYELRTTYKESKPAIQECLNALEKNIQKFYDLVNTIIKEQVEKIKKQLASCLNAISSNLTPEERLHEIKILSFVIEQIIEASPQLEMIINHFIKMMSQKDNEQHRYQKDLDRKTLRFLLLDDSKNRTNFLAVVKWMEKGCCTEEEKLIIEDVIAIVREKNVFAECSSCGKGKENIEECESQHEEKEMEEYEEEPDQLLEQYNGVENVTKSSERDEEFSYSDDEQQEQTSGQKTNKKRHMSRKRKTKNIKIYEPSYERTYETLVQLQQSLNSKKIEKLNCNVDEDWTERFRKKFLKKSQESK